MADLQEAFKHLDDSLGMYIKETGIPGMAITITDREKLIYTSNYGFADVVAKSPVTTDSLFEIASIGKSFTAIALLQLRDEGILDLHTPVARYLPWFQVHSEFPPITVHHLMGHTAGIIRGTEMAPHGLYDSWALRETKTNVSPGHYWHYSSISYKTLGFLLEKLTGWSLKEVIQSRVLKPLGMTNTHPIITFETRRKSAVGYCSLYDDRPEHPSHELVPAIWNEYGTGDGCQASTAGDLAIFLRMLMNRGQGPRSRLISEDSFKLMAPLSVRSDIEQYGYAMVTYPVNGHTYLGHGGVNAGYTSHILADVDEGLGTVVLTNRRTESEAVYNCAVYILEVMRAAYHGIEIPLLPMATNLSSIDGAADYTGRYRADDKEFKITLEDAKLLMEYKGKLVTIEKRFGDSFYADHPDFGLFLLEFSRDGRIVTEAFHGAHWYTNERYTGPRSFDFPREWEAYKGHYRTRNPELSNFRVIIRKGTLVLVFPSGNVESLVPLGENFFRISEDDRSPETIHFRAVLEGQALRADYSGCPYYRTFTY